MAIYSVYLPPEDRPDARADEFRLVSDAKAPLALIFPPFWLAWHRLWLELLAYCVIVFALGLYAAWNPSVAVLYLSAIPGFYLLLEGNDLVRRKLERKGWRFAGVVDGENTEAAEIRFITQNPQRLERVSPRTVSASPAYLTESSRVLPAAGLFPE
ncbi:MAG: DUF2628 domain-containing protein [Pseudomonadota bacterium]